MKKLILFLAVSFLAEKNIGQNRVVFPDSNCVWSVFTTKTFIQGDTIIGAKTYQKYYATQDSLLQTGQYLRGCIRNDSAQKKIYFLDSDNQEKLLYNFNLTHGDTLQPFTISYNQYNKVLVLFDSASSTPQLKKWKIIDYTDFYTSIYPTVWCEGVGCVSGFLFGGPLDNGITGLCFDCSYNQLLCQHVNGIRTYGTGRCYEAPTSIRKYQNGQSQFSIYPNPASKIVNIESTEWSGADVLEITITELLGKTKIEKTLLSNKEEVNIETLNDGVYFIRLVKGGRLVYNAKFVKHNY